MQKSTYQSQAQIVDGLSMKDASIIALSKLATQAGASMKMLDDNNAADLEDLTTNYLDSLNKIALALSIQPANNICDLKSKVSTWKTIADECIFDTTSATPEERLLVSILNDIQQIDADT